MMTYNWRYVTRVACSIVVLGSLTGGCVKRAETITVHKDGSVRLEIKVEGDRADMESGAPAIARAPGWKFAERLEKDDEGKETVIRTASTTIPPRGTIPATYPTNDPEGEAMAVQHPTTLIIERRADGTYYHFRRVFEARPWAYLNYYQQKLIEEPLEQAGDTPPEEFSPEKKRELVQNIIRLEAMKHLTHARRVALSLDPPMRQDYWVQIYQAVQDTLERVDTDDVLKLLDASLGADESDEAVDEQLTELADELNKQFTDAIRKELLRLGMSGRYATAFGESIEEENRRFAITEDYGDELWGVYLSMPGRLVGHNGDRVRKGKIEWSLDGKGFYDRQVELLATSVVTND